VGELLVDSGNKLMAADSGSNFGRAVVSVGECWKDINEAQKTCNERVMDGLVQPIKGFTEVQSGNIGRSLALMCTTFRAH